MELALGSFAIESIRSWSVQNFMYMFPVFCGVVGIGEDVIKVYDYRNVKHVSENIIHEALVSPKGMTCHLKEP